MKNTASIHIVINPPIWATWYAKSLYTLLILCIIYLIFRSYKKTAAEEFFKGGEKLAGDGKEKSAERTRTAQ